MTKRRNTLSIDELRPEEEGYAWPRRRQRLDTDFSVSTFGNVETGLVRGRSSEWSDWFNGSSSRASNESTTSSWDSPLSDEGSRENTSSWGLLPSNRGGGRRENASSWGSPPSNFGGGRRENASSWGSPPSNCGGGRRENASSWGLLPSNIGGGRRENVSSWGSSPSNFGGGRREKVSSWGSPPSNCGGEGRRENVSSWGSPPSNFGGDGRRENASSRVSPPLNCGGGRRENVSSWGSPPSNFGGSRRENASSWGLQPSNFGGGRRENALSWESPSLNFDGDRRENASSWGSPPSNFGGDGRRENASSRVSPPSNCGGGRRENVSSWGSPPSNFGGGRRENVSSWGSPPSNFGGGRRENVSSWGSPPSNFGGEGRRENASSWGSQPSNFGGEGRRENALSWGSPPSNCGGEGRRENVLSWGSPPSNFGGGRRENASSWGSQPSNFGGGRRENASSWGSQPSNFGGEGRRENALSRGSPPSNCGGEGRRENASSWGSQPSNCGGEGRRENALSWGSPPSNCGGEGRRENVLSWGSPPSNFGGGRRENASPWGSQPSNFGGGRRENVLSWESPPLNFDGDRRENASSWGSPPLNGEGRRENVTSSNQNGSDSPNDWWTGGANGLQTAKTESFEVEEVPYSSNPKETLRMALPDAIKCITEKKYLDLTKFGLPCNYSAERIQKVLASIVIKRKVAYGNSRLCIVSLGAGSKAIDGRWLSKQGDRVHDCHAEVLARRGMLRFLYAQLEKIKNGCQHQSIFVKYEGSEVYTIRNEVSFHLFISKPPCGDASVFGQHELHPNRLNRGTVRATPSNGEGAVYIPEDDKTFDHFKHGARLHKMCCSAKIARWNVIGIQGALLSLYIEPVYLSSITIGSNFNASHMRRAVYTRVSKIDDLPSCYRVENPSLYKVQHSDNRNDKAHKMSLNWCLQHPKPSSRELIECLEGTCFLGGESQLAKRELFKHFISLWASFASRALKREATRVIGGADVNHYPYDKVKALAEDYQQSKCKVAEHFSNQRRYGSRWLKMPREVDQFSLREEDRSSSEFESSFGLFRPT